MLKKVYLASLKFVLVGLDVDKVETDPVDLSKLKNVVKNDVVKISTYDELVKKYDSIDSKKHNLQKKKKKKEDIDKRYT